jgi:hypothetical protein
MQIQEWCAVSVVKAVLHSSNIRFKQYTHRATTRSTFTGRLSLPRPSTQVFRPIKIRLKIMIAETPIAVIGIR